MSDITECRSFLYTATIECRSFLHRQVLLELDNIVSLLPKSVHDLEIEIDHNKIHLQCDDEVKLHEAQTMLNCLIQSLMGDHQAESKGHVNPGLIPIMIGKGGFRLAQMREELRDELQTIDEDGIYKRSPIWIRIEENGDYILRMPYQILNSAQRQFDKIRDNAQLQLNYKHQRDLMAQKGVVIRHRRRNVTEKELQRREEAQKFQDARIEHKALYRAREAARQNTSAVISVSTAEEI